MKAVVRPVLIAMMVLVAGCGASAASYKAAGMLVSLGSSFGH